ncbi:30S ribosomal subunit protein S17 [Candidatus Nasuia deltocephalinicola]|uniref:30S ribosomal protein S17 n=1 Tax=Candidatus Nasuia deltocephalincola TaxID=1160784 RepID=A0A0S2UP90_9PROT|nr:30S ribosomal subunit protein S17 [Candidatus Nasuia deltocephalinicola]
MKILKGIVFSIKSNKTVIVKVFIFFFIYKKRFFKFKKYLVNDEFNICLKNEIVFIIQVKPYSKKKFWKIFKIF